MSKTDTDISQVLRFLAAWENKLNIIIITSPFISCPNFHQRVHFASRVPARYRREMSILWTSLICKLTVSIARGFPCSPINAHLLESHRTHSDEDVHDEGSTGRADALRPWNAFRRFLLVDVLPAARVVWVNTSRVITETSVKTIRWIYSCAGSRVEIAEEVASTCS